MVADTSIARITVSSSPGNETTAAGLAVATISAAMLTSRIAAGIWRR
jgi:hypothetical protein